MTELVQILKNIIVPLISSCFFCYVIVDALIKMGCAADSDKRKRNVVFAVYTAVILLLLIMCPAQLQFHANILLIFLGYPIAAHFVCNPRRIYLIYYFGFSAAVFLMDILANILFNCLVVYGILYFNNQDYYLILYILVSRLLTLMMARIYVRLIRRLEKIEISRKRYLTSLLLPLFSIVDIYTLLYFMQVYMDMSHVWLFILNVLLMLAINIWYPLREENRDALWKRDMEKQQESLQQKHYEELERKYAKSQSILHDIRGMVQTMEQLYREDASEQASGYAKDLHLMLNELVEKFYTDNKVLNIILNDKARQMEEAGMDWEIRVGELDFSGYKDVDITVIFQNILNNAIRAAKAAEKPGIRLRAERVQDFISIHLWNTTAGKPCSGKGFQGTGLKNVERCIAAYRGDIQYQSGEKEFTVQILLPVTEEAG